MLKRKFIRETYTTTINKIIFKVSVGDFEGNFLLKSLEITTSHCKHLQFCPKFV